MLKSCETQHRWGKKNLISNKDLSLYQRLYILVRKQSLIEPNIDGEEQFSYQTISPVLAKNFVLYLYNKLQLKYQVWRYKVPTWSRKFIYEIYHSVIGRNIK